MKLSLNAGEAHRVLTSEQRDALCDWLEAETPEHRNDVAAITLGEGVVTCECIVRPTRVTFEGRDLVGAVIHVTRTHAVRTLPPVWPQ